MTLFAFRPADSALHRLDTRCKLFMLALFSLASLATGFTGCAVALAVLFFFLTTAGIAPLTVLWQLRYFILMLGVICLTRALTTPGTAMICFFQITVTGQGLVTGALVALRFFLVMLTGLLFSVTTRPASVKAAVQWYLAPLPWVPEKRVGVMIGLALGFLPLILRQAQEAGDAVQARCGNLEKNPVKRLAHLALPMVTRAFGSADHLILAMEARCYSEERTDPGFNPSGKEAGYLLATLGLCLFLWFVPH